MFLSVLFLNYTVKLHMKWSCFQANWPFAKTQFPMSNKPCRSQAVENTLQNKEETDNAPTDKTEQVTSGIKQSLSFQMLSYF